MKPLFGVSVHTPTPDPTSESSRRQRAEEAFVDAMGSSVINGLSNWTFHRSCLGHAPIADIEILLDIFDHYLTEQKPAIMALTGKYGWHNGKRTSIDTADGIGHNSKTEACLATLRLLVEDGLSQLLGIHPWVATRHPRGLGMKQFSFEGARAFCNASPFMSRADWTQREVTKRGSGDIGRFQIMRQIEHYAAKRPQKFADALRAYLAAYKQTA
jgi:hypothetical protein